MRRLPIRLRLALSFTAAAAVLLTAVGGFGYQRLASRLLARPRPRAPTAGPGPDRAGQRAGRLADRPRGHRVRGARRELRGGGHAAGRLLEATPTLHDRPLLSPDEAAAAARGTVTFDRQQRARPGRAGPPARHAVQPVDGRPLVLVVGDTRENGLEVLRRVRDQLLVGIPLLVLLTFARCVRRRRRGPAAGRGDAPARLRAHRRRPGPAAAGPHGRRRDLTRLGETLNALLARVEATLDRERSFVAHASHELRTPLALLRTELELAVRRPRPAGGAGRGDPTRREDEVDRLQRLAEDLLLLAQAGEGRLPVARRGARRWRRCWRTSATGSRRQRPGPGGRSRWSRSRTWCALTAAAPAGADQPGRQRPGARRGRRTAVGETGRRRTSPWSWPTRARVSTDDLLPVATERFVRSRASTGAGLGLAIVAAVAEAHHGSVGVANVPGGAEAWISVPMVEAPLGEPVRA